MQKIIFCYFVCFVSLFGYAQTEHPFTSGVDAKLQLLDKEYIATDILYDRVVPFAQLRHFNQGEAIDTSNANHFFHAYAELQNADYIGRWEAVNVLMEQVAEQPQNHIPVGIIHVEFEYLDERAIVDELLNVTEQDSLLVDVPNRSRSPYLKKTALVISPLVTETNCKTITFVTGGVYKMLASAKSISSIAVDFQNGQGFQPLPTNGAMTITFPTAGIHHLRFRIQFTDESRKYTYAKFRINDTNSVYSETELRNATFNCVAGTIISSRKFQGYTENTAYSGAGEYEVRQGGSDLDQPVIVLDGFDPKEGTNDNVNLNDVYH